MPYADLWTYSFPCQDIIERVFCISILKEFERAKSSGISNSQLYKQTGNSIVVNVLEEIFKNLLKNE